MNPFPWDTLIDWYKTNGRHSLPWRDYTVMSYELGVMSGETDEKKLKTENGKHETDSVLLYRVWLSEILLQQTQASRVVGYFERMIERFPTIESLGETDYDTFFPYYQGLGYYSRARNILRTAKIVSEEYGGVFPRDKSLLSKLPGVGGYTSSAILAFGYGDPYLAWDTNLEKVFARYYHGTRLDKLSEEEKKGVEEDFHEFCNRHCEERSNPVQYKEYVLGLDRHAPLAMTGQEALVRAINNALMDFASLIDLKNPDTIDWETYPLISGRFYETRGSLEPRAVKVSRSFPIPDATVVVILHKDHKVYYGSRHSEERRIQTLRSLDPSQAQDDTAQYSPFVLSPPLTRDTREYVKSYFRDRYGLELSVRPAHKKGFTEDGKPYLIVNAQIQTGESHIFKEFARKLLPKNILDIG